MNIFMLDANPKKAAEYLVDRHVVKMCIEYAQLLSTAHFVLKSWKDGMYEATHIHHPSAKWVRACVDNYDWLYQHWTWTLDEYTVRYDKIHACNDLRQYLMHEPRHIPWANGMTPIPLCMPDEYKGDDRIEAYRKYYDEGKRHLHSWKRRKTPPFITVKE